MNNKQKLDQVFKKANKLPILEKTHFFAFCYGVFQRSATDINTKLIENRLTTILKAYT